MLCGASLLFGGFTHVPLDISGNFPVLEKEGGHILK